MNDEMLGWMTTRKVATRLGVSTQYVGQLIAAGRLRAVLTEPRVYFVDPASVAAFEHERAAKHEKKGRKSATEGEE